MKQYDLIIIGGGSAGLACAISAYENGVKNILILEKEAYLGGILNQCIHNGFGLHTFKEELTGPEYAHRFITKLESYNIEYKLETTALKIEDNLNVHYLNKEDGYKIVSAKSICLSTGCSERTRGNIAIDGSRCKGILTAGLAQKYLNCYGYLTGKKVFILGSGDIGLIMARRMVLEGAEVLGVAELMPYSNGLNRNIVQCLNDYNIPLYLHTTVKKIIGKDCLEKIILCEVDDNLQFIEGKEFTVECDTLLLSVGLIPNNPLLVPLEAKMHPKTKGPVVDNDYQTSVRGIFACGNSLHVHDLVDFVTEEGTIVGKKISEYLNNKTDSLKQIEVNGINNVNYVIPSYINSSEIIDLKFRVSKPFDKCSIVIKNNDKIIKEIKKPYLLPAEMVSIKFDTTNIENGKVTLEVKDE